MSEGLSPVVLTPFCCVVLLQEINFVPFKIDTKEKEHVEDVRLRHY